MKFLALLVLPGFLFFSCGSKNINQMAELNKIATDYVKLALEIGQYDGDFVDAYYGPDSLKPTLAKSEFFPKDSFLKKVEDLQIKLVDLKSNPENTEVAHRAEWIDNQLMAFGRRIKIFSGETEDFDTETLELFGCKAPVFDTIHFENIIKNLNTILPGNGDLKTRYETLSNQFIIPKDKIDTIFKTSLAECRKRTLQPIKLPEKEQFNLEYVGDKAWSGYNWYKGNFTSLIQINTDFPISIERAIDVGSHESYPGHHVYNMLLEQKLYKEKGWVEMSIYPLFSPQSLIAEGSANFGIEMAFPGNEKVEFAKNVLLPLAGLDTTGINAYFKAKDAVSELNYAGNEVGRAWLAGKITDKQAIDFLIKYGFYSPDKAKQRLDFTRKYRGYIINYNYGKDLIKNYVEKNGGTENEPIKRWSLFESLLDRQVLISELL